MQHNVHADAGPGLRTYTLYIHDDRYSVPSLDAVTAVDEAAVRALARKRLATSPHYRAVEIWEDDRLVGVLERPQRADPSASQS